MPGSHCNCASQDRRKADGGVVELEMDGLFSEIENEGVVARKRFRYGVDMVQCLL
jgi:hypothetical protein